MLGGSVVFIDYDFESGRPGSIHEWGQYKVYRGSIHFGASIVL